MRQHPLFGEQALREGTGFEMARRIARWQNLDGSGYPDGLKGSSIPLEARILRITDAFDAITNVRPTSRRAVSSGPSQSSLATGSVLVIGLLLMGSCRYGAEAFPRASQ